MSFRSAILMKNKNCKKPSHNGLAILKIMKSSQENPSARTSFLIMLQGEEYLKIHKKTPVLESHF